MPIFIRESVEISAEEISPPEFLPASISQGDVGVDECVVNVVWSESFISCSGSVSQYVLSVTPPTSDCGSEDCVLVTDQTHYDLTLTVDQTYNLTVRADTCNNTLTGDYSDPLSINTGQSISYNIFPEFTYCSWNEGM